MEENIIVKRNTPRDVFLHLLAMVTLYWSAITFLSLLWDIIDHFFPDVLFYNYYYPQGMRFAISSLIIVFPLFIIISRYLNRIYRREAQVRESKIRKWLLYLTLFVASMVMIGDLVTVINTFLGGEITMRFVLKAISVLLVAAAVFGYYLDDVRKSVPTTTAKYFAWGSAILVLIVVIGAFFIVGSPAKARLATFDNQKITDLQNIQYQIINYWQRKEKLPNALSDLTDNISGFTAPLDPQTKANYEYRVVNAVGLSFELCATFNLETPPVPSGMRSQMAPYDVNQNWDHGVGRVCFERTIDKQLYPPISKTGLPVGK